MLESEPTAAAEEPASNLLDNVMKVFVLPEIENRRAEGRLGSAFELRAAQVILNVDAADAEIRLNNEVKAKATFKVASDKAFEAGDVVTETDVDGLDSVELYPTDSNAGHITLIRIRDSIHISFDFQRNRARIADHLSVARQFLDSASEAVAQGRLNVFGDTLFSATELLTKAFLFTIPKAEYVRSRKHEFFRSELNILVRNGVADSRFAGLLNRTSKMRESARYLAKPLMLSDSEVQELLALAEEMYAEVRARA